MKIELNAASRLIEAAEEKLPWGLRPKTEQEKELDRLEKRIAAFKKRDDRGELDYAGKMSYKQAVNQHASLLQKIKKAAK